MKHCRNLEVLRAFNKTDIQNKNSPLPSPCKSVRERALSRAKKRQFEERSERNVETRG